MSYTPGPWRVNESKIGSGANSSDLTEIVGPQRNGAQRLIAKMYGCAHPEGQANARLIAAAPELYETLMELYKALVIEEISSETRTRACLRGKAVCAKVRGDEGEGR